MAEVERRVTEEEDDCVHYNEALIELAEKLRSKASREAIMQRVPKCEEQKSG